MVKLPGVLHDDTVTIVRVVYGGPDADGVPVETTDELEWTGVNVQQASTDELDNYQQERNTTHFRVSGPPVDIEPGDRIRWRGEVYLVDGVPDTRRGRYRIERTRLMMYQTEG